MVVLVSAKIAMAPDGSGETRCGICQRIGHAHPRFTAVVTLVDAPNPPLYVYPRRWFIAAPIRLHGLQWGPHKHRVGISTTAELGHRAATASAAAAVWPATAMDPPGATTPLTAAAALAAT